MALASRQQRNCLSCCHIHTSAAAAAFNSSNSSSGSSLQRGARGQRPSRVVAAMQHASQQPHPAQQTPDLLSLPQYQPFQTPDFNPAEFTSRVLAASRTSAHAQAEELRQGVRTLESALAAAVVSHHGELLGHARRLADAEAGAADVAASVASLQAAVRRVRAEVETPYTSVRLTTRQLAALHDTAQVLRALLQRIKLTGRLRQVLETPPAQWDLAKAAKLLGEVGPPDGGDGLAGVALVADDAPFLEQAGAAVRDAAQVRCRPQSMEHWRVDRGAIARCVGRAAPSLTAQPQRMQRKSVHQSKVFQANPARAPLCVCCQAMLLEGMDAVSQAKVGSALQVFYNLGELRAAVDALITRHVSELDRAVRTALDSRHLSLSLGAVAKAGSGGGPGGARGVTMPQPGAAGSWQEKLWQGVRCVADMLVSGGVAVWHLQRVAAKKRDPISHVLFLDELCSSGGGEALTDNYWCVFVCHAPCTWMHNRPVHL